MGGSLEHLAVDFLVLGAGMAGMTAAGRAASAGLRVLVVEKGPEIGGSAVLSGGKLWTAKSLAMFEEETPGGDPALARAMLDWFEPAVDWIRSTGVFVAGRSYHLHYGQGHDFDILAYIRQCRLMVEQAGGWVVRNAWARDLLTDGGRVSGAVIAAADGDTVVTSPWTLLATGGFSASPELRARYIHPGAGHALARSNPFSTGDGMRLGLAAGGSLSGNMGGFYGHVIQSPVTTWGPREFRAYTQGGSIRSLLLNRNGERFCDESLGDHQNAQRILEQPGARALIVFDEAVRREEARTILAGTGTPIDKVQIAIDEGAHVAKADSWAEVFAKTEGWGFARERCLETVLDHSRRCLADPAAVTPPRRRALRVYAELPFYALEAQAGVTATHGGLAVDTGARVLDSAGRPVPGLLAAGADAGNVHGGGYAGGLCFAAVFGLLAAAHVIETA